MIELSKWSKMVWLASFNGLPQKRNSTWHDALAASPGYSIQDTDFPCVIFAYLVHGLNPGSFMSSLIANDLSGAVWSSHSMNRWNDVQAIVKWLETYAPGFSYGSHDAIGNWCTLPEHHRLNHLIDKGLILTPEQEMMIVLKAPKEMLAYQVPKDQWLSSRPYDDY